MQQKAAAVMNPREPSERRGEATTHTAGSDGGTSARRFSLVELFGRAQEVIIEHNGRDYRLRLTAQGKLLLTA